MFIRDLGICPNAVTMTNGTENQKRVVLPVQACRKTIKQNAGENMSTIKD